MYTERRGLLPPRTWAYGWISILCDLWRDSESIWSLKISLQSLKEAFRDKSIADFLLKVSWNVCIDSRHDVWLVVECMKGIGRKIPCRGRPGSNSRVPSWHQCWEVVKSPNNPPICHRDQTSQVPGIYTLEIFLIMRGYSKPLAGLNALLITLQPFAEPYLYHYQHSSTQENRHLDLLLEKLAWKGSRNMTSKIFPFLRRGDWKWFKIAGLSHFPILSIAAYAFGSESTCKCEWCVPIRESESSERLREELWAGEKHFDHLLLQSRINWTVFSRPSQLVSTSWKPSISIQMTRNFYVIIEEIDLPERTWKTYRKTPKQ